MTVVEFLAWDAPIGPAWQLRDGVPVAMAPASGTHALIQNEVGRLIGNHLSEHRPRCRVLSNPGVVPNVDSEHNCRIPDIGVTCVPVPRSAIEITQPMEILSPGNQMQTWKNAWDYTTIPSLQEILVIRTASIGVQLLRRSVDGTWPEVPLPIETGDLELESIAFHVPVRAL